MGSNHNSVNWMDIFTYICWTIVMFPWKDEFKWKRDRGWHIFEKLVSCINTLKCSGRNGRWYKSTNIFRNFFHQKLGRKTDFYFCQKEDYAEIEAQMTEKKLRDYFLPLVINWRKLDHFGPSHFIIFKRKTELEINTLFFFVRPSGHTVFTIDFYCQNETNRLGWHHLLADSCNEWGIEM